jgi:hypothetical protein
MKPANAAVIPFPKAVRRDRDELAFLPAALEIVETPPSPTGRAIGVTIIALFCLALGWAAFGKIDIVASAPADIGVRRHKLQRGGRQWSGKLALGDSADAMTSERNVASSIAAQ